MAEKDQYVNTDYNDSAKTINAQDGVDPGDYVTVRQRDLLIQRNLNVTAHGITAGQIPAWGLLPVYRTSGGGVALARSDAETTLFDFFVSAVPGVNDLTVYEGKFLTIAHGLALNTWFCLDPVTAGNMVDRATLDARASYIQFGFFTLDANTLLIRPQAGFKDF